MTLFEGRPSAGPGDRFAIVAARWHPDVVEPMVAASQQVLQAHGSDAAAVDLIRVPGAWEVSIVVERLARAGQHAAIIALGCIVRGDTRHYEQIADECARGLAAAAQRHGVPVAHGVLAVEVLADAKARAGGSHGNKGEEAALAALEMVNLLAQLP